MRVCNFVEKQNEAICTSRTGEKMLQRLI
jgi:hypothetical protein